MNHIEWIPTKERLPEKSGEYLAFLPHPTLEGRGNISPVMYSAKRHLFNAFDDQENDKYSYDTNRVSHWAELPEPPEGWTL